jgi:hypothetical protein
MTCFGSFGTLMPQSKVVREIERSLQARLDEGDHLVAALGRTDEIGVGLVEREQLVLVGGELEEVARLLDPLDRRALRSVAHAVGAHSVSFSW